VVCSARLASLVLIVVAGLAAGRATASRPVGANQNPSSRPVRVLLAAPRDEAPVRASSVWRLVDRQRRVIARGRPNENWLVQREPGRVRAMNAAGVRTAWFDGPAVLELSDSSASVVWDGRRYRGVLLYVPADTALFVVNRVHVEEYLRGVVPLETGTQLPAEHAAVEAQAVAARSFTYTRMLSSTWREYDLTASTLDQVYGGAEVETAVGDLAVASTAGWILAVGGRVVMAPYHSTCGGATSAPSEVWRTSTESFLRSVSDRVPGRERSYCETAPRFRWERTFSAAVLAAAVRRYAPAYARLPAGPLGAVRDVVVEGRTPSGRVSAVVVTMERARLRLRGDQVRYVLRTVGGEILPSTYFSLQPVVGGDGRLSQLVVRGQGHGHGVGMCQWGAIGRARAGQDFRAILRAYYPGAQLLRAS